MDRPETNPTPPASSFDPTAGATAPTAGAAAHRPGELLAQRYELVELLGTGAGIVVPHGDPLAIADAIRLISTDPEALVSMAAEARRIAPSLSWAAVAEQYADLSWMLARSAVPVAI